MKPANHLFRTFAIQAVLGVGIATQSMAADKSPAQTPVPVLGVKELLKNPDPHWDKAIVVEGLVAQVCPRSGAKAWLHDLDPQAEGLVRVERVGNMPGFGRELEGKTLRVTGVLRELRIDTAYLDAWEGRLKGLKKVAANEDPCTEKCEESQPAAEGLKRVQALREELARLKTDHISALWVDGAKWQVKKTKK